MWWISMPQWQGNKVRKNHPKAITVNKDWSFKRNYIYIYICIYISISISISIYLSIYIYIYLCILISIWYIYTYIHILCIYILYIYTIYIYSLSTSLFKWYHKFSERYYIKSKVRSRNQRRQLKDNRC